MRLVPDSVNNMILFSVLLIGLVLGGCDMTRLESDRTLAAAQQAFNAGSYSDAIAKIDEACLQDPTNGVAWYYGGIITMQKLNDAESSLEYFEKAVEYIEGDGEILYQYGVALLGANNPSSARQRFVEAVAADPFHGPAWYRLGQLAEEDQEIRDAIDLYSRAIYADPRFPMSYNALGNIYARFGRWREARMVFQNGIDNENPNDEETLVGRAQNRADLGRVFMELQEYEAAVNALRQAVELRPESASANFNLGVAFERKYAASGMDSDRENALQFLRRANGQCNFATEGARCEAIEATLRELESL